MILITYSKTTAETIEHDIGKPEYSYYFIWKKYLPAMERVGTVVAVRDPLKEVDALYHKYRAEKEACVFLSFTPPDGTALGLRCPTVCVFAWEFSTIPNEAWDGNKSSNWVSALERIGYALTLSTYAEDIVKRSISPRYPIATVPAPVCSLSSTDRGHSPTEVNYNSFALEVSGKVVDSDKFDITFDRVTPIRDDDSEGAKAVAWDAKPLRYEFNKDNLGATQLMVGFYAAEEWGAWSRTTSPWIILPKSVRGKVELAIEMLAYGDNVDREIKVVLGSQSREVVVSAHLKTFTLSYDLEGLADAIQFSGLTITQTTGARDHRTLGLGIKCISVYRPGESALILGAAEREPYKVPQLKSRVTGNGVVYTSVLNPADGRKNWEDMVSAFCWAFKDTPDAILILKMTHTDSSMFLGVMLQRFSQLAPFKCRVIAIQGYLDDEQYANLIAATNYVVNTSYCEGQCLPLMEYMAQGIPAVSPDHTAMADYITKANAFIVNSNTKPTFWPNDERRCYRALMYEVNWGSIKRGYEQSYRLVKEDEQRYLEMGRNAYQVMQEGFSVEAVTPKLEAFLVNAAKRQFFLTKWSKMLFERFF